MTRSIRRRLQWWYGAVYAVSLIVFGCLVYWRADRDVHERATLQVIATAQYLDVSLRGIRPHLARPGERLPSEDFTNQSNDPFSVGLLFLGRCLRNCSFARVRELVRELVRKLVRRISRQVGRRDQETSEDQIVRGLGR